ncbi:MAG: siderophore biosynthesis protein [Alteromonadaceae bacterium]|nr:siderophore biosynthesis protein [Alteromonadaceae bacterium]
MLQQLYTSQLQKLIDALSMENFNGACDHMHCTDAVLSLALDISTSLELPGSRQAGLRPYRILGHDVVLRRGNQRSRLEARQLMAYLVQANWWPTTNRAEAIRWWEECFDFIDGIPHLVGLSTTRIRSVLAASELLAMAADRPFHPFAHAKGELAALVPAPGQEEPLLHWWAFSPHHLIPEPATQPAESLLGESERAQLDHHLERLASGWVALPVLPDQHRALLTSSTGTDAVNLGFSSSAGHPTSSLRTLISVQHDHLHLKLSTSARTLGAIRSMPPRYLVNGDQAHRLLTRILAQQPALACTITLCDESQWWVVGRQQDLIRNPGLHGCQLRYLPKSDDGLPERLVAMSALGFGHVPVWQQLLGDDIDPWRALKALTAQFIHGFLTLWRHGVMPECHGQNVLARYQGARLRGFVLRDHDTLRICPARLERQGLPLPAYQIDWSTPNSLVLESEQELLAYFVTLGLQVNLYPIALATLSDTGHHEADFWRWVQVCLEDFAATLDDEPSQQAQINALLAAETWPFKQILTPLLNQRAASTGMPSAMARIRNPLQPHQPETDATHVKDHEATV